MDPVQSGFAEQFFPAAALLRYTYAREQKLDLGRRFGKSRRPLEVSEEEEAVNQLEVSLGALGGPNQRLAWS